MKQWSCSLWVKPHVKDDKSTLGFWLLGCFYKIGFFFSHVPAASRPEVSGSYSDDGVLFVWHQDVWDLIKKAQQTVRRTEFSRGRIFCSVPSSTPTMIPRCWAASKESSLKFGHVSRPALYTAEQSWTNATSGLLKGQMSRWQFQGWFWDGMKYVG